MAPGWRGVPSPDDAQIKRKIGLLRAVIFDERKFARIRQPIQNDKLQGKDLTIKPWPSDTTAF